MTWLQIINSLDDILSKRPDIELAMAEVFEQDYLNRLSGKLRTFLGLVRKLLVMVFRQYCGRNEKLSLPESTGLFSINVPRTNDFGIIFSIIKEMDKKSLSTTIFITPKCYKEKKGELKSLGKATIIVKSKLRGAACSLRQILGIYINAFKSLDLVANNTTNDMVEGFIRGHKLQFIKAFIEQRGDAEFLERIFTHTTVNYIVSLGERKFGLFGKRNNIRTYAIQHGHFTPKSISFWNAFTPGNSSEIIVFGEKYSEVVRQVYPRSKPVALGNPYYDNMLLKKKKTSKEKITITFFSSFHAFQGRRAIFSNIELVNLYLDFLIQLYESCKDRIKLRIKLHPNESEDYIINYGKMFGREIEIVKNKDSFDVLKTTDMAMSCGSPWGSTVDVEAVLSGTLSVQLLLSKKWEFTEQDWSLKIYNYSQLKNLIDKICSDPEYYSSETKRQYSYIPTLLSNIGHSAQSISDHILKNSI